MTYFGEGNCPHCSHKQGPHALGKVVTEYDDAVLFEVSPHKNCSMCGQIMTEFLVDAIGVNLLVKSVQESK